MVRADLVPQFVTLQAIAEQQTANLSVVGLPDNPDVKITWLNNCDLTVDACADNVCTFAGESVSSYVQTLSIDQCAQTEFSESFDTWRENEFGMAEAQSLNMLKAMKAHVESISQYAVGVIEANLGTNIHDNQGQWTINGDTVEVPGSEWETTAIYGKLRRNAVKNRLDMPYILTGENLDQLQYMALTNQANGEGKGDAARVNTLPAYFDLFNIEEVNDPLYVTYLINKGALAIASKGYFPRVDNPQAPAGSQVLDGNYERFSIANAFFPSVIHDVERVVSCPSGVWKENYRLKSRYKVFVNPTGCDSTRTGLLSFTNTGI